jgi:hypothetical protein
MSCWRGIGLEPSDDEPRPWTLVGAVDLAVDEVVRQRSHAALTDPELTRRFRRRYPLWRRADYDDMVRALGYVWDCPYDGTANVTGHCCASCGRARAQAGG